MLHVARNQDHDDGREVDDINRQMKNANKTHRVFYSISIQPRRSLQCNLINGWKILMFSSSNVLFSPSGILLLLF